MYLINLESPAAQQFRIFCSGLYRNRIRGVLVDKFLDFLKKHKKAVICCTLIVLFAVTGVPLIINWAFSVPAWCKFFAVDWDAKDALAYYGSALGFIGTVIFSGLALWQNHVIKTESDINAM